MTYRGDYSSTDFRRALNKVSITFHGDEETRKEVRELNEMINSPDSRTSAINRKIVGLIYDLCHRNGFSGITEYDIDQSFPEQKQIPTGDESVSPSVPVFMSTPLVPTDSQSRQASGSKDISDPEEDGTPDHLGDTEARNH